MVELALGGLHRARGSIGTARMSARRWRRSSSRRGGRSSADWLLAEFPGPWPGDIDRGVDTNAFEFRYQFRYPAGDL